MLIIPSIASADTMRLAEELDKLKGIKRLHVDIEDGNFVPNITFGMKTVGNIAAFAEGMELDVHLLVMNPMDYLRPLADCGIRKAAAHLEALRYPMRFLNMARQLGISPGLALNVGTPLESAVPFIALADYLILMTAEPDERGELFYEPAIHKVRQAVNMFDHVPIHVDGGIGDSQISMLRGAGVKAAVAGRAVFSAGGDYIDRLRKLSDIR